MNAKLKAAGLCLVALALSSIASTSAPATVGGHFVYGNGETQHALLGGSQWLPHTLTLGSYTASCEEVSLAGTGTATTTQSLAVVPTFKGCSLGPWGLKAVFTTNNCSYTLTSGAKLEADNTLHLQCPFGKTIEIEYGFEIAATCKIKIPVQSMSGASYTQTTVNGKYALIVDLTVSNATVHYEGGSGGNGFCITPTVATMGLHGSFRVSATTTGLEPIDLRAT